MALNIPRVLQEYGLIVSGVCGVLGTLTLWIGGPHRFSLGLSAALFWSGLLLFVELRGSGRSLLAAIEAQRSGHKQEDPFEDATEGTYEPVAASSKVSASEGSRDFAPLQLQGAKLDGARLDGLDLRGAAWTKGSAVGADMRKANVQGADFSHSTLQDVNLQGCVLHDVTMLGCILEGANLSKVRANRLKLEGASVANARLLHAELKQSNLKQIKGIGLDMNGAKLAECSLVGAALKRANGQKSSWRGVDLGQSRWAECKLSEIKAEEITGRGVRMEQCKLEESVFVGADFRDGVFLRCEMGKIDLEQALLDGADLSHSDLSEANLTGASLKGVNLSGTNLSGANLSGANLTDTDLSQCIHNMLTTWPDGVRPDQFATTLDEASLSEMVEELTSREVPRKVEAGEKKEEAAPKAALKNIPKIQIRQPGRDPQKTMPLDDQDLHLMQELADAVATPPPAPATKERAPEATEEEETPKRDEDNEQSEPEECGEDAVTDMGDGERTSAETSSAKDEARVEEDDDDGADATALADNKSDILKQKIRDMVEKKEAKAKEEASSMAAESQVEQDEKKGDEEAAHAEEE